MSELIGFNPLNKRSTYVEYPDPSNPDVFIIRECFDKSHATEARDRVQDMKADGLGKGEGMRVHASVPPYVQVEIANKYGQHALQDRQFVAQVVARDYPLLILNNA